MVEFKKLNSKFIYNKYIFYTQKSVISVLTHSSHGNFPGRQSNN